MTPLAQHLAYDVNAFEGRQGGAGFRPAARVVRFDVQRSHHLDPRLRKERRDNAQAARLRFESAISSEG
jgi:hypothetical protein